MIKVDNVSEGLSYVNVSLLRDVQTVGKTLFLCVYMRMEIRLAFELVS
jgi:hypothetical protein